MSVGADNLRSNIQHVARKKLQVPKLIEVEADHSSESDENEEIDDEDSDQTPAWFSFQHPHDPDGSRGRAHNVFKLIEQS